MHIIFNFLDQNRLISLFDTYLSYFIINVNMNIFHKLN